MDRYTMIVAICGQATAVILIVTVLNTIVRYRRAGRGGGLATNDLQRVESRLADMQQALDAVAVEVERISEAQRFTTKLLAERGPVPVAAANGAHAGNMSSSR